MWWPFQFCAYGYKNLNLKMYNFAQNVYLVEADGFCVVDGTVIEFDLQGFVPGVGEMCRFLKFQEIVNQSYN